MKRKRLQNPHSRLLPAGINIPRTWDDSTTDRAYLLRIADFSAIDQRKYANTSWKDLPERIKKHLRAKAKRNPLFTRRQKRKMRQRARHAARTGILKMFGIKQKPIRFASSRSSSRRVISRAPASGLRADVISALQNLGYSRKEASRKASAASGSDFESLFRSAQRNPGYMDAQQAALNRAAQEAGKGVSAKLFRNGSVRVVVRGEVHHFDDIHEALGFLEGLASMRNPQRRGRARNSTQKRAPRLRASVVKRRRNPEEDDEGRRARKAFRDFHGYGPDKVTEMEAQIIAEGKYFLVGRFYGFDMVQFPIERFSRKRPNVLAEGCGIMLCAGNIEELSNGKMVAHQLFLFGGNQELEPRKFGIGSEVQLLNLGQIKNVWYIAKKAQDGFELLHYHHTFGEEGGERPDLMYDRVNKKQFIIGGDYTIPLEGIRN